LLFNENQFEKNASADRGVCVGGEQVNELLSINIKVRDIWLCIIKPSSVFLL